MFSLSSINLHIGGSLLWAILVPAAIGLAYFAYLRTNPPIPPWLRALLRVLRGAALCLLLMLVLEPVFAFGILRREKPTVGLLVDRSESMGIADPSGGRWETAMGLLRGETVGELAERANLVPLAFADRAVPFSMSDLDTLRVGGMGTDISGALAYMESDSRSEGLYAVLMLSDGGHNLGRDPGEWTPEVPVYAVGIGSEEGQRDLRITGMSAPEVGYAEEELTLEAAVEGWGYEGTKASVILSEGDRELDRTEVPVGASGTQHGVTFQVRPEEPGRHTYTVRVSPVEGEVAEENNAAMAAVEVLKSRQRILILAGGPSADLAFLRRSLARDERLEVVVGAAKQESGFYEDVLPSSEAEWRTYDLVILLNLPRTRIAGAAERLLAEFVRDGGGLLVMGGRSALGGEWARSPLAEVLPVVLEGRQNSFREGSVALQLAPQGREHFVSRLSNDPWRNEALWKELPPLLGWNGNLGAAPGATTLLVHPTVGIDGRHLPLAVVGRYERGRTMVAAFSSFWRMDLMMWGIGRTNEASDRLWNNTVRWLTTRTDGGRVRISTDRTVYRGGERIVFEGWVYDEVMRPLEEAEVRVRLVEEAAGGERTARLDEMGNGRYRMEFASPGPGTYRFEGAGRVGDRVVGGTSGRFVVSGYSLEFAQTRMDRALLTGLARRTGGRFYTPEQVSALMADIDLEPREVEELREVRVWNRPWVLIAIVVMLAGEWTVRRRRGML